MEAAREEIQSLASQLAVDLNRFRYYEEAHLHSNEELYFSIKRQLFRLNWLLQSMFEQWPESRRFEMSNVFMFNNLDGWLASEEAPYVSGCQQCKYKCCEMPQ